MQRGMYGDLASITPPITIPAWACAMTGKTPGQLGIYGMRNRKDTTYEGLSIATSLSVKEPTVWDLLGEPGHAVAADRRPAGLPARRWSRLAHPVLPHPAVGAEQFTLPAGAGGRGRTRSWAARSTSSTSRTSASRARSSSLDQVFKMTERRFQVARRLVTNKPWDYFMMVEMGPDRLHHCSGSTSTRRTR